MQSLTEVVSAHGRTIDLAATLEFAKKSRPLALTTYQMVKSEIAGTSWHARFKRFLGTSRYIAEIDGNGCVRLSRYRREGPARSYGLLDDSGLQCVFAPTEQYAKGTAERYIAKLLEDPQTDEWILETFVTNETWYDRGCLITDMEYRAILVWLLRGYGKNDRKKGTEVSLVLRPHRAA